MVHDLITSRAPEDIRRLREQTLSALRAHRSSVLHEWMDIGAHLMPREGRFSITDRDQGGRHKHVRIMDSTPQWALRVSKAGIRAGTATPERKWFDFETLDPDLNRSHAVREWLDTAVDVCMLVFGKSNAYRVMDTMWGELLSFSTSAAVVTSSFENIVHLFPVPVGEFFLAQDNEGHVNTMYREFEWTVGETVDEFGLAPCSDDIKLSYKHGHLHRPVTILQAVEPRRVRNPKMLDSFNMPWQSIYLELGNSSSEKEGILRETGFKHFPVLAPRWDVTGRNVYGHGPGMDAMPDIRQLNQEQFYKSKGVALMADPPVQAPASMKELDREMFAGGVSFYHGQAGAHAPIRNARDVKLDLDPLLQSTFDIRGRVERAFYADMFLLVANSASSTQRTATEVATLHEEKLLQLGPTLQRLEQETLAPLVNMVFRRVVELEMLPPAPPELEGHELNVEFVGILAQAQRALSMKANERWLLFMQALGQMKPEAMDKVNADEMADMSARAIGVDAKVVVPTKKADALREARNEALAAKEQLEAVQGAASAAKDFSSVDQTADGPLGQVPTP